MSTERQARLERALPEAVEALLRAHDIASEAQLAGARAEMQNFTQQTAASLAAFSEVDDMGEAELLEWLLVDLRPLMAAALAGAQEVREA
jgi:hypothetical protein